MYREELIIIVASLLHGNGRSVPENVKKALEIEAEVKKQRNAQVAKSTPVDYLSRFNDGPTNAEKNGW